MKHFDYIPELDGPQSYVAPGGRTILCKGDGGGGSGTPYYSNMDRLYGVQSQAAEYMLGNSMPYIPQYMANSNKMVTEAMDGTLANQMRQRAGNESQASYGSALASSDRNMQRYGMGFSADRLLTESNRNAIMGAAGKAGTMNNATATAEDMKWNRNAGGLGQATGMGMGSMESVGSAARGYGAAAGQVAGYDALNSAGYGKFGAAVASNAFKDGGSVNKKPGLDSAPKFGLGGEVSNIVSQVQPGGFGGELADKAYGFSHPGGWVGDKMEEAAPGGTLGQIHNAAAPGRRNYLNSHANGGYIKDNKKPGLHLATGGGTGTTNPWAAWQNNNPIQTSQPQGGGGSGLGDAVGAMALGASPILIGKGVKAGLAAVKGAMTPAAPAAMTPTATTGSGLTTGTASIETGGAMANGAEGAAAGQAAADATAGTAAANTAAGTGAEVAGTAAATDAATVAGTDIAATAGTDAAATAAADAALTAGTTAAAETAGAAAAGEMATAAGTSATMGPVGWVAGAALALGALGMSQGWFADGGGVRRKDFTPGGKVSGKGTETSDDIPAWLSDGEHVQNSVSAELAGLDTLDNINDEGLKVRRGRQSADEAKANIGRTMIKRGQELTGGLHMASGGNVGIALGAAADEWNKQREIGMAQSLTDLRLKLARPQLETQDDQIAAGKSLYKYQNAASQAGLDTLPQQTANTKKQQQISGIGLDNTLTGYAGQKMSYGNKDQAIKILNQAAAAQPGFDGTTVLDVTPQKDGAGVFLHMSDKSIKPVSREEIVGAMGTLKQGDYQFIHDNAGNVYTGNKATGDVAQKVKGDPAQMNKQNSPADVQSAEWLMTNVPQYKGNAKAAWEAVRSSREKTRTDFVLDYVSKNSGLGGDVTKLSQQAGEVYDTLRKSQSNAATSDVPGSSQTGTGKSGTNWREWAAPAQ